MSDQGSDQSSDSRELAVLILDGLLHAGLLSAADFDRAVEIATEEIDVRIALGHVELK